MLKELLNIELPLAPALWFIFYLDPTYCVFVCTDSCLLWERPLWRDGELGTEVPVPAVISLGLWAGDIICLTLFLHM